MRPSCLPDAEAAGPRFAVHGVRPVTRTVPSGIRTRFAPPSNGAGATPRAPEVWSIGFLTGRAEGHIQEIADHEMLNVFLPTTPNPTSGFLLFVPRAGAKELTMTIEEGLKMVVSGGLVTPPERHTTEQPAPSAEVSLEPDRPRAKAEEKTLVSGG